VRFALILIATAACGSHSDPGNPGSDGSMPDDLVDAAGAHDDAATDAAAAVTPDAANPDAPGFPSKLDLHINCHNDCTLVANPSSIAVPAGTEFTVNWINTGDTDCDVAKIDQFNQVPIIIGLEPGTSYHDSVRKWCGQFTGTFEFRVTICTIHSYIPVDCDAP
jgi:hypothetical protein